MFSDPYDVGNVAYFLLWVFMALGLCLMWGYGGLLSFGQTFFFGIGGYGYGIIQINLGHIRPDQWPRLSWQSHVALWRRWYSGTS